MPYSEAIKNSKILIIDDDEIMRVVLRLIFQNQGFTNITEAVNGQDGWEQTIALKPDIVFLDINMPIMNGLEYCTKARANPDFSKMVILVQTGVTDLEEKKNIFAAGATDYVSKPIDPHEIIARSIVHLKNSHYLKELEDFNNRVKKELQSAKRLVDISLPNESLLKNIKHHNGIEIFSYFQSSSEMGGDFWNVHVIDDNKIAIYVVDFSGHGVDSALNATRLDCLIKSSPEKTSDPSKLMEWLNNNLYSLLPAEQYATMFYGVIDTENNRLTYVTAACPEMFILLNSSEAQMISGEGYPLGAVKEVTYNNQTINFNKEDILLLYSDALIETEDSNGNFLSSIPEYFLKNYKGREPALLRECFDMFVYRFMSDYGSKLQDDLTVVLCSRESK